MMSAPVHRDDETDDSRLYAPKWVREPPPSPATDTGTMNSPVTPAGSGDITGPPTSPSWDAPESIVSPPTDPSAAKARAERHKRPVATAQPQAALPPRMAPGVGGPNIPLPPWPPALY